MFYHRSFMGTITRICLIYSLFLGGCQPKQVLEDSSYAAYTEVAKTILAGIVKTSVQGTMSAVIAESAPQDTPQPSSSPASSYTPNSESILSAAPSLSAGNIQSTDSPIPNDILQPSQPLQKEGSVQAGTYLVGSEIAPGLYYGNAMECVYEKLSDLSGSEDAIISSATSYGQFFVDILPGDYAFLTDCAVYPLKTLPESTGTYPLQIRSGMYLVGIEIQPGKYKGDAVDTACYWERMSDVTGGIDSVIINGGAVGEFYVQVLESDFALLTSCPLEWIQE